MSKRQPIPPKLEMSVMPMQRASAPGELMSAEDFEAIVSKFSSQPAQSQPAGRFKKEGTGFEGWTDAATKAIELLGGGSSTQVFDPNFGHLKLPAGMIPTKETAAKIKAAGPLRPSAEMKIGMMPDDFGLSGFFSKAKPLIAGIKQPVMQRRDLLRMLQGKGVRNEELKWTGLLDELNKDGKITKQELDAVMKKAPRFKEVVQQGTIGSKKEMPRGWRQLTPEEIRQRQAEEQVTPTDFAAEDWDQQAFWAVGPNGELVGGDNANELLENVQWSSGRQPVEKVKWSSSEFNLPGPRTDQKNILIQLDNSEQLTGKWIVVDPTDDSIKHIADSPEAAEAWRKQMNQKHPRPLKVEAGKAMEPTKFEDPNHWDEHNVLGWLRTNKRQTLDGEKVLHIDEWQSEWGNKARKYEIKNSVTEQKYVDELKQATKELTESQKANTGADELYKAWEIAYAKKKKAEDKLRDFRTKAVEPAPFIGHGEAELLAKRALLEAAQDPSVKHLTWTTGQQQAERYGLDRHFEWIRYDPDKKLLQVKPKDGSPFLSETVESKDLGEHIGDELASNLLKTSPMKVKQTSNQGIGETLMIDYNWHRLTGPDLRVEDKGKREAYDVIFKNQVERWSGGKATMKKIEGAKQYKPSPVGTNAEDMMFDQIMQDGFDKPKLGEQEVWSIPITDALREKLKKGFPMYAIAGTTLPSVLNKKDKTNSPLPPPPTMAMMPSHPLR